MRKTAAQQFGYDKERLDEIQASLPHGGSLWPCLDRMAEVSAGMQQLEWALLRKAQQGKSNDPPEGQ